MRCSSNGGAQWDSVSAFGANTITSLITYQNTFCAAVSGVGFAVSTDNGASWTLKNSGLTNLNINVLYKIGSTIFACTQGGGIFKTLNLGSSWTPHNEGISNLNIYSIGVKTPYLYLGSDSGKVYKRLVSELVSVEDKLPTVPERITLEQNYPNPFNPTTTIRYQIPEVSGQSRVTLNVYDLLGRAVGTLVNEDKAPGEHSAGFDATHLPSGVYFYRLTVGSFHEVKKMVLCR
ncbi:MAG: T9SS type A sorting domain-containing protein [Ignavibacteriae bacterium]|nr:T9SS type A sorting domain-containing protein [Ignavibacteriota bacterium]